MVGRDRFCQRCRCADRDIVRHKPGYTRRGRRLDTGAGAPLARLYQVAWRQHRRCRVHERARSRFDQRQDKGYDATEYGRDFRTFLTLMKQTAPEMIILGHGTIGTSTAVSDLFAAAGSASTPSLTTTMEPCRRAAPARERRKPPFRTNGFPRPIKAWRSPGQSETALRPASRSG